MIKGFIGTSLIDFPGKIASVVFFGGCNYCCPFCQNSWLVSEAKVSSLPTLEMNDIVSKIAARSKMIDGVVFSGGEPTLYPSLLTSLLLEIKRNEATKHLQCKLDTNGSRPVILKELLSKRVLDYIAIDLKTSPEKYDRLTGVSHSVEAVRESLQILSQSDIPSEIRTTFVPGLVDKTDVVEMISFIREAKHYYIQSFRPKDTLDESYLSVTPYSPETLHDIAELIRSQVTTQVTVRI